MRETLVPWQARLIAQSSWTNLVKRNRVEGRALVLSNRRYLSRCLSGERAGKGGERRSSLYFPLSRDSQRRERRFKMEREFCRAIMLGPLA